MVYYNSLMYFYLNSNCNTVYLFENFFRLSTSNLKFSNNLYIHIKNILYLEVNI